MVSKVFDNMGKGQKECISRNGYEMQLYRKGRSKSFLNK